MIETEVKKSEALPPVDVGSKNDLELKEDVLNKLGVYLKMRYDKIRRFRDDSTWAKDKAAAFDAYHMVPKKRDLPFPGASNLSSPLARIGVDAFHANVMSSLYANGKDLAVKAVVNQKDFAATADKAAKYMSYVMNQEAESYSIVDDAEKKAEMYGKGYLEPVYVKEEIWETVEITDTKEVPEQDEFGNITFKEVSEKKKVKKKKVIFDGTKIQSIPIESIYRSPFLLSIEQAVREDVVFKMFKRSFYSIKESSKDKKENSAYYIRSQVKKIEPIVTDKIMRSLSDLEQSRASYDGFYMDMLSMEEMVELGEAHLWYDIDGDDIKEEITATFNPDTSTVIRVSLSPCRIVEIIPRPIEGRGDGEGIPKICENLDIEWENFHNTRANAGQWENTTFGFYRAGGRLNPQQIQIRPGHFYPVDDPREISFPNIPRVGSSFFQEESLIINYFERIFALDENIQGVSSKGSQTATETIRVSSKASIRFSNPFNRIVTSMDKLLRHVWELNQECAPASKQFFFSGEDGGMMFDKMDKYDFSSNLKFTLEVSSVFDQQLTRDTVLLAYRLFLANPLVQQHPEMLWKLSQETLDTLNVNLDLPRPPQANVLSPYQEHQMFKHGEDPEPQIGEDVDYHLKVHLMQLNDPSIKEWDLEAVKWLMMHIDKTKILKAALESANLNKSGMYTGNPAPAQPSLTANRNPTQMFNTMKVGESGKSMAQNTMNGQPSQGGPNAQAAMDATFGNQV